jgi:hypothetical protein
MRSQSKSTWRKSFGGSPKIDKSPELRQSNRESIKIEKEKEKEHKAGACVLL